MIKSLLFKMYYFLTKKFNVKIIFKIGQAVPVISPNKTKKKTKKHGKMNSIGNVENCNGFTFIFQSSSSFSILIVLFNVIGYNFHCYAS